MSHKTHHLYYLFRKTYNARSANLFYPRGWITIVLPLFSTIVMAQEQTPPPGEFPVGSHISYEHRADTQYQQLFRQTGLNRTEQDARQSTSQFLIGYNLGAANMNGIKDYIYHYSSSYYSKWEAEENADTPFVGVKHKGGQLAYWYDPELNDSVLCWSTQGLTDRVDSLVYGPHYHQDKWYRRWLYNDPNMNGIYDVRFIPRYRMALNVKDTTLQPNEEICRISVWVRNAPIINGVWNGLVYDHLLKGPITLKASDFPINGKFDYIYFSNLLSERWYKYPPEFQSPLFNNMRYTAEACTVWADNQGNNGVEFRVEWLGNIKCDLYIDYIEVYDDFGWRRFIEDPFNTTQNIIEYAKQYADSFSTWNLNLVNWMGCDEPSSIDAYTPLRIVDSILASIGAPRLMVHFYPQWYITVNNDSQLVRYYKTAKPDRLNIHFFPFSPNFPTPRFQDWETFRTILQISYNLTQEKGFWYKSQNFGTQLPNGNWINWRQPDSSELKAEIMLALAHGINGLMFSHFDSFSGEDPFTHQEYTMQGFIGEPPAYIATEIWFMAKDNLIPRLKGKLGKTLMKLNYTGDYLQLRYSIPTQPQPVSYDYLTLGIGQPADYMNWHCGFFNRPGHPEDKYFLLANLYVIPDSRTVRVRVTPPVPNYQNYRF